jgi:hypothetical protein
MNRIFKLLNLLILLPVMACSEQSGKNPVTETDDGPADQASQTLQAQVNSSIKMDIFKSPTCGCCGKWAEHAEQRGLSLTTHHPEDLNRIKQEHNIGPQYQSCHTVVSAEGYVFEGHIPARYIHEFLAAPPDDAIGLAVPAMPAGSPGMEMGDRFKPYQVLLLKRDGGAQVFAEVRAATEQYN